MYNVLMILLHRPFVADGHLYNTSRAISVNSFMSCATAADDIVALLRVYDKAFSVRRAPYLMFGCVSRESGDELGCSTRKCYYTESNEETGSLFTESRRNPD
jgi:hypothetical protein